MKMQKAKKIICILFLCTLALAAFGTQNDLSTAIQEGSLMFADEKERLIRIEQFKEEIQSLLTDLELPQQYYTLRFLQADPEIIQRQVSFLRARWLLEAAPDLDYWKHRIIPALDEFFSEYAQEQTSFTVSAEMLRDGRFVFSFADIKRFLKHSDISVTSDSCWIFLLNTLDEDGASFEAKGYFLAELKPSLENALEKHLHDPKILFRIGFYNEENQEPFREDVIYHMRHPDFRTYSEFEMSKRNLHGDSYTSFGSLNSRQIFHNYHDHYIVFPYLRTNRFYNSPYLFSVFTNISPEEINKITSIQPFVAEKPYFAEIEEDKEEDMTEEEWEEFQQLFPEEER